MRLDGIRVLVVDDHPVFRDGLTALLELSGAVVLGTSANGEEAVKTVESTQPDVVLMDLNMPGLSGIEATRLIVETSPHVKVLVVTMHEDDDSFFAAMRAGAAGYLLKGATPAEIKQAVQLVTEGGVLFGPGVAARARAYFSGAAREVAPDPFPELTKRERELLELVASGLDNAAIATRLGISHKTVKNHVSNVFTKLRVSDRANAIIRARESGLGS